MDKSKNYNLASTIGYIDSISILVFALILTKSDFEDTGDSGGGVVGGDGCGDGGGASAR